MKPSGAAISLGFAALVSSAAASPAQLEQRAATVKGFDISSYQPNVDFHKAYADGARFVIIKATEGTTYTDKTFSKHYTGATKAKLIRGAYHFAHPGQNQASAEADFFVKNGGGWSGDGITLPGMVDLESEKGHPQCWGLSHSAMVAWIRDFADTYREKTTRWPMLYTNPSWWSSCTGNSQAFKDTCPLVLARYAGSPGAIPGGWRAQTIWQNSDKSPWGGDSDVFNGDLARLKKLATG
ncbi:N,O-diacetylmuramidase [Metarhizium anisopliae]|nr:N,O-diacetylmuramidase [Metarhizium anisopliae]